MVGGRVLLSVFWLDEARQMLLTEALLPLWGGGWVKQGGYTTAVVVVVDDESSSLR